MRTAAAISRAACAVRSSALPSGMFRMIWNSLLLSNGSIFTFTQPMPTERHRSQQQPARCPPGRSSAPAGLGDQRPHDAAVEPGEEILLVLEMGMRACSPPATRADALSREAAEYFRPQRRMRIAAHGVTMKAMTSDQNIAALDADRNRPHVRPHQPADEGHRQHRRDHGEGGEDGRVADFVDRFDRDGRPGAALVLRQMKVADDVFDHDDGVVHQDADARRSARRA